MAINEVQLLGVVCDEPYIWYPDKGVALWHCLLAVNRPGAKYQDSDDKKADYIHVIVWGDEAKRCNKHVRKGSQIAVLGRIQSRNYTKTNLPSDDQYNKLMDLFTELDPENGTTYFNQTLEILELDGSKSNHVCYEVSARSVEFLNNCVFTDSDDTV